MVQSYSSTEKVTGWKKSSFILSEWSDFHITKLSVQSTSVSVDETLLPWYVNWSTNFYQRLHHLV